MSRRSPRILMTSGEAPPMIGGVGDFSIKLLMALRTARPEWSFRLLTRRPKRYDLPFSISGGVPVLRPVHGWTPRLNDRAVRLARNMRYDLLHVQEEAFAWFESDVAVRLAELRPEVPVVVTLHELHQDRDSFRHTRRLIEQADAVATNDQRTADRCLTYAGRKVDRVSFSPSNIEPFPEVLRPPKVPGLVCTFGFINRLKRFDVLYDALKRVRATHPELSWRIVGPFDPPKDADHREVADLLGDESWIRFTGALDALQNLPRLLHETELLLLPFDDGASLRRGSLQGGWRFGLPIVTTRPLVVESAFRDGKNIVFADREDPDTWAEAILRLLESPQDRERIGWAGFETSKAFSFEALARDYLAIYEQSLGM